MDIGSFERITHVISPDTSLEAMLKERSEQSVWQTGEWNTYLSNKLGEDGPQIPYLEGVFEGFVHSFKPQA